MFGMKAKADAFTREQVTLASALEVIDVVRKKAERLGVAMNIAVVNSGANLVAFVRMDGAWLGSIEIARSKAYTARAFDMTTKELSKIRQPGEPANGISSSNDHKVAIFLRGIPLKVDGNVVGAVGASGGLPNQDHEVAEAFKPDAENVD
ncbi:MAG: heme-binding protein [Isosphaeraceae bacterium]